MAREPSSPKKVAVLTGLTMLAGGVEVSPAIADAITGGTQTFHLRNDSSTAVTAPLTFNKFNQPGTLTGVTFTLDSQFIKDANFIIPGWSTTIQVDTQPPIASQSFSGGTPLTYDITNPPGLSGLVGALDTNFYTGTGGFTVTVGLICGSATNGCEGGVTWFGDNSTGATEDESGLTLTYDFNPISTPIPLPGSLPLFATGLAGLGFTTWLGRRKQKRQADVDTPTTAPLARVSKVLIEY